MHSRSDVVVLVTSLFSSSLIFSFQFSIQNCNFHSLSSPLLTLGSRVAIVATSESVHNHTIIVRRSYQTRHILLKSIEVTKHRVRETKCPPWLDSLQLSEDEEMMMMILRFSLRKFRIQCHYIIYWYCNVFCIVDVLVQLLYVTYIHSLLHSSQTWYWRGARELCSLLFVVSYVRASEREKK